MLDNNTLAVDTDMPELLDEDVFSPGATYLSIETPLDRLFAEHRSKKANIENFAKMMDTTGTVALRYFIEATNVGRNGSARMPDFDLDSAVKALDAEYWSAAVRLTDVLDLMPAATRHQWHEQIKEHQTPPFEEASVRETLRSMIADRTRYFAERVDGVFRALSRSHVTNVPQGFGKRMIIASVLDQYGYVNHQKADYVADLRKVIARFMGRDEEASFETNRVIGGIASRKEFGEWKSFDGGAFRMRIYRVGTAHLEVHPLIAYRLNQVLASLYPAAIPEAHRVRPAVKKLKEFVLDYHLVSVSTVRFLIRLRWNSDRHGFFSGDGEPSREAREVLQSIGGVPTPGNRGPALFWSFDYDAAQAIEHIIRTGQIPTEASHQYYPTPADLVDRMLELADVGPEDTVLEPSAGQGNIALRFAPSQITCVELSALHVAVLAGHGLKAECADFLSWETSQRFSRIVMNPPFSQGRAVAHLEKAAKLLAPGGRLVAILPATVRGKEIVPGMCHAWSESLKRRFGSAEVSIALLLLTH